MRIRPRQTRLAVVGLCVAVLGGTISARPNGQTPSPGEPGRRPGDCVNLTGLTFDGNTTITSAAPMTSENGLFSRHRWGRRPHSCKQSDCDEAWIRADERRLRQAEQMT